MTEEGLPHKFTVEIPPRWKFGDAAWAEIQKRIGQGITYLMQDPSLWADPYEPNRIHVDIVHVTDAFPEGFVEREKCIVDDTLPAHLVVFVFIDEHYVDRDGNVRFE